MNEFNYYSSNNCVTYSKEEIKQFYIDNPEYHERRKDKWRRNRKLRYAEKYICECGCEVALLNKVRHDQTQKHISKMKTLQNNL